MQISNSAVPCSHKGTEQLASILQFLLPNSAQEDFDSLKIKAKPVSEELLAAANTTINASETACS